MGVDLDAGPKWDGDVDDPAADNIIKVMFNDPGWKWIMDCWQVTGTQKPLKIEASPVKTEVEAEAPAEGSQASPAKKESVGGMENEQFQMALKDISDAMREGFGTCLREMKLVGDRVGAVEKKMGALEKKVGALEKTTSTNPAKPVHEPGVSTKTSPKIPETRVTRQSVKNSQTS
ncbi:hypothetical protein Bca4012_027552 [Brassica carinata]